MRTWSALGINITVRRSPNNASHCTGGADVYPCRQSRSSCFRVSLPISNPSYKCNRPTSPRMIKIARSASPHGPIGIMVFAFFADLKRALVEQFATRKVGVISPARGFQHYETTAHPFSIITAYRKWIWCARSNALFLLMIAKISVRDTSAFSAADLHGQVSSRFRPAVSFECREHPKP